MINRSDWIIMRHIHSHALVYQKAVLLFSTEKLSMLKLINA